jgi:hypothetical protein
MARKAAAVEINLKIVLTGTAGLAALDHGEGRTGGGVGETAAAVPGRGAPVQMKDAELMAKGEAIQMMSEERMAADQGTSDLLVMAGGRQENDLLKEIPGLMAHAQPAGGAVTASAPEDQMEQAAAENRVLLQKGAGAQAAAEDNERRPKFGLLFYDDFLLRGMHFFRKLRINFS